MQTAASTDRSVGGAIWAGRILSGVVILFLLFDGVIKLIPLDVVVETSEQLGIPSNLARTLGVLTLACTFLYAFPVPRFSARSFSPHTLEGPSTRIFAPAVHCSRTCCSGSISV